MPADQGSMTKGRRITGAVLLVAAPVVLLLGAGSPYSSQACDAQLRKVESITGTPPP